MGLLSAIGKAASNIVKAGQSAYAGVVSKGTEIVSKAIGKPQLASTKEEILKDPVQKFLGTAATAVAAALGGAAIKTIPAVSAAVKSVIPKSTLGKAGAVLGAATILQSEKATEKVGELPRQFASLTTNVAGLIDNPSLSGLATTIKESPVAAGVLAAAAIPTIGGGIGLALNTLATRENTLITKQATSGDLTGGEISALPVTIKEGEIIKEKSLSTDESTAVLPQTQDLRTTRRRKSIKKVSPISNRVQVNIQNNNNSSYRKIYKRVRA